VPLFVSRRVLTGRTKTAAAARAGSGRSTRAASPSFRCSASGRRRRRPEYVADVRRFADEIGRLAWVAPQDWMCEPFMLEKTGLTIVEHQRRTVDNFVRLRDQLGSLVVPVLQGWDARRLPRLLGTLPDGRRRPEWERLVGVGSVCRRQNMVEAGADRQVARAADGCTGFGVKITGLASYGDASRRPTRWRGRTTAAGRSGRARRAASRAPTASTTPSPGARACSPS
jgi:hypothetical protein